MLTEVRYILHGRLIRREFKTLAEAQDFVLTRADRHSTKYTVKPIKPKKESVADRVWREQMEARHK